METRAEECRSTLFLSMSLDFRCTHSTPLHRKYLGYTVECACHLPPSPLVMMYGGIFINCTFYYNNKWMNGIDALGVQSSSASIHPLIPIITPGTCQYMAFDTNSFFNSMIWTIGVSNLSIICHSSLSPFWSVASIFSQSRKYHRQSRTVDLVIFKSNKWLVMNLTKWRQVSAYILFLGLKQTQTQHIYVS